MKKIIAFSLLLFAFSINASAQSEKEKKEKTFEVMASKDLSEISKLMDMNDEPVLQNLHNLFLKKHKDLAKENISASEQQEIYTRVDQKLRTIFSEEQIKKFQSIDGLYDKLIK
jgi:5-formyltetrahydrofolate cyclo-ligase